MNKSVLEIPQRVWCAEENYLLENRGLFPVEALSSLEMFEVMFHFKDDVVHYGCTINR